MSAKRRLKSASAVPPTWVDRTSNSEEENAAARIQATFRGYFLRKLLRGYVKGRSLRDGPLEKLLGGGGGEFSSRRNLFSLSNFLYEFFLGHSMNIF